jgi:sporulation protein YlmC with PRC-barrel domain
MLLKETLNNIGITRTTGSRRQLSALPVLCVLGLSLLSVGPVFSAARKTGRVSGTVVDAKEGRIIGATVTIQAEKFKRTIKSDQRGEFQIDLPAGRYRIKTKAYLFQQKVLEEVEVEPKQTKKIVIHLEIEEITSGPPF